MAYRQGISDAFVEALNGLCQTEQGAWWQQMLADHELFVAVRDGYLNVYFRGCSLAKITFEAGEVTVYTHYKYLLKPRLKSEYVRASGGIFQLKERFAGGVEDAFTKDIALASLKAAATPYAGEEKKFVGKIIQSHPNVVDVEVALTTEETETALPSAKRIDLVTVRRTESGPVLDFYEAKLFGNKEIRAQGDAKVLSQIATYEDLLSKYESDIRAGFARACENVIALKGLPPHRKDRAVDALNDISRLRVNLRPFLIIGGFDKDQQQGQVWLQHKSKLSAALGEDRLVIRGSASSVRLASGGAVGTPALG